MMLLVGLATLSFFQVFSQTNSLGFVVTKLASLSESAARVVTTMTTEAEAKEAPAFSEIGYREEQQSKSRQGQLQVQPHNFTWKPLASTDDPGNALFYNIYIPHDPKNAMRIVKEQLDQVATSSQRNLTVYYSLIGHPNASKLLEENNAFESIIQSHQFLRQVRAAGRHGLTNSKC